MTDPKAKSAGFVLDILENTSVWIDDVSFRESLEALPVVNNQMEQMRQQNMVRNPGFESGTLKDRLPRGWEKSNCPLDKPELCIITADGTESHTGDYSMRIDLKNVTGGAVSQVRHVLKGDRYKVSGWIKTALTGGYAKTSVGLSDRTGWIKGWGVGHLPGTYDWTYMEKEFAIPQSGVINIYLHTGPACKGTVWFDDISMIKVGKEKAMEAIRIYDSPAIDGKINDACWLKASKTDKFYLNKDATASVKENTEVYLCYDDKALYIAFKCYESRMDEIKALEREHDGMVWHDDCVEVFLDPEGDGETYYHFLVNPVGSYREEEGMDLFWNAEWEVKTSKSENHWIAEMAIPFSNFKITPKVGSVWRANFCREEKRLPEDTAWSPTLAGFHTPSEFGTIYNLNVDFSSCLISNIKEKIANSEKTFKELELFVSLLPPEGKKLFKDIDKNFLKLKKDFSSLIEKGNIVSKLHPFSEKVKDIEECLHQFIVYKKFHSRSGHLFISNSIAVGIASNLQKILPDRVFEYEFKDKVSISAAKGEYEGFQIVCIPFFGKELGEVSLEISELTNSKGFKIDKKNIECHRVGYVKTRPPGYSTEYIGYWPDPLLPLGIKDPSMKEVKIRPFWVTVRVPEDIPSGNYCGEIIIKADALSAKVKINLNVYNFSLPRENHLCVQSPFDYRDHSLHTFYQRHFSLEELKRWDDFLLDYRINPSGVIWFDEWGVPRPSSDVPLKIKDYTAMDEYLSSCFKRGMTDFKIQGTYGFSRDECGQCDKAGK
ncbi:MAG: hypothetical protein KAX20_03590, partial [Candidatus Omnitrophica bacterium]|nr:hypothetical protein [Candidatus Omnitrophota bacterium]